MMVILILSLQSILISGVIFYAIENGKNPQVQNIFDGIWWSVITLTTIGYGDIYPMTFGGRTLAIVLALIGIGLVALPTGILTSGFIRALRSEKKIMHLAEEFEEEEKEQDDLVKKVKAIETVMKKAEKPSVASSKMFTKKSKK